jgi:hypothetical protein
MKEYPKYLYKKDNGARFTLINGFYSMDDDKNRPKFQYEPKIMIKNGKYFVDSLNKCDNFKNK